MQSRLMYDRFKYHWSQNECFCCYLYENGLEKFRGGKPRLLGTNFIIEKEAPEWCPYLLEHSLHPETIDLKNVSLSDIQ